MTLIVNGVAVPVGSGIVIEVNCEPAGEILPPVTIAATGGHLDVYRSHVHYSGDVSLHLFGGDK